MDYIRKEADGQLALTQSTEFLMIPSCLYGFSNKNTVVKTSESGRTVFCFEGTLNASEENTICSCGSKIHVNNHPFHKIQRGGTAAYNVIRAYGRCRYFYYC